MLSQAAEVRLGRQRAPQYEQGDHVVPYLRSANVVDGKLDLSDVKTMNFTPAEQEVFGLADGDVLVTEGSGSLDTVGTSAVWRGDLPGTVCFQNTLLRLRPRVGVTDGRYLSWWVRHAHASRQMAAVASGANIQHIGADGLKRLSLVLPSLEEQRRIADFLDDRVARIDRIIGARRAQVQLVTAAFQSSVEATLRLFPTLPVRYLAREILVGIVIQPSKLYTTDDGGVPALRGLNVREGEIVGEDLVRITPEGHRRNPRSRLRVGDVVVVRTGDAGSAAVVPRECNDWNCIDLVIVRPNPGISAPFLELALNSARHQASVAAAASGAMQQHFGVNALAALSLPYPGPQAPQLAEELLALREETARRGRQLRDSIDLMHEYRQALITAAVTGEIDVTTADSGIPG